MGGEWKVVKLKDSCRKIGSGATPSGGSSVYLDKGDICLIRSQNIYNDGFKQEGIAFITPSAAKKLDNVEVLEGDVLLNITGDSVARVCLAPKEFLPARVNQHVAIIRPKINELDPRYLRYFLASPIEQAHLLGLASAGATRPALTKLMIESLEIPLPPLPEQRAIAHILGSLDDKIALNRKLNATLEAMAQALFQSWFVDFDPVIDKALAAGHEIPEPLAAKARRRAALGDRRKPLPPAIAALFPDRFVETEEMGWVPEGWEVKELGSLVRSVSEPFQKKGLSRTIFLNTGDILEGKFLHSKLSDLKSLPGQAKKSIMKGDILYSEIRPENKRFAYVFFDSNEYVVSTKLMVLRAFKPVYSLFTYYILKQQSLIDRLQVEAESRSGTFPQITFGVLAAITIILPQKEGLLDHFSNRVLEIIFQKTLKIQEETESLSALRDTLLPKLISGELRLRDAEATLQSVLP